MSDRHLALTLAKVIIAAAWADGKLTSSEINCLKDLLFRFPHDGRGQSLELTAQEWAELDIYIHAPVGAAERARLVEQLQNALRRPADKQLAIDALEEIIQADGDVTANERAVLAELKAAINAVDLNIFAQLGRLLTGPMQRRSEAVAHTREAYLEDFIKNRVYYNVRQRLDMGDAELNIPEEKLRKLSLAGGLMARVARTDREVNRSECDAMIDLLQANWDVSHAEAAFIAEVAASEASIEMDYYRLTREFMAVTTAEERECFLDVLFAVADADDFISADEHAEIRQIAYSLYLTQEQFIQAKLKIPRERRET
jgi:uncharacterized tellurite resistance protein B-like protein